MNTKEKIDLPMLKAQKQELLKLIWNENNSILWGIVNLLDDIQDEIEGVSK